MSDQTLEFIEACKTCDAFFKEILNKAVQNQNVQISNEAIFYLMVIISGAVKSEDKTDNRTLAERFALALQIYSDRNRAQEFKTLGDSALIIAGIWWQSLSRKIVDIDYYIEIGKRSYQKAGEISPSSLSELFEELSDNLLLYETWLKTHNAFLEKKLRELGINPVYVSTKKQ